MERLKKVIADAVFVIQILIIFTLLFESRIVVPALLQSFGRMHPLMLHLPIGLLIVAVILLYSRKYFEGSAVEDLYELLLHFTAVTASLTTLMGLYLSLEGNFGADQLRGHKWLGVGLSFICWGLLALRKNTKVLKPVGLAAVVVLVFTGHYGANLTHGEDFVWAPLQTEEIRVARVITDSTTLFTASIEPVLEAKCYGCHNPKKAKGNLVLSSMEGILKGGESGALWHPGDASNSLLVERLLLPLDHDEHMPPKDKAQLGEDEIVLISMWIDHGADLQRKLKEIPADDTLSKLASRIVPRYQRTDMDQPSYTFRFASPEKIAELKQPNRSVFQIARNEPAVQADFFLRERYEPKHLEELLTIKEQLVSLNLSKMPVKDADINVISKLSNLEILNLNHTDVTGEGVVRLASMQKLKSLSLAGTNVDAATLRKLTATPSLREVFIWNTRVSAAEVESLKREFPQVQWNIGFIPDSTEVLKLNPPVMKNKSQILARTDKIFLKHSLPGTELRYTLDGSEPDSIKSAVFSDGIEANNVYTTVKAKAYRDGWLSSNVVEFFFFRKGFRPDSARLETEPDKQFEGEGTKTLLDGKLGLPDFYRDPAWIAFSESDMVLAFSFEKEVPTITNVTLSFAHNKSTVCLPPNAVELWGGNDPENLQLISKHVPPEVPIPARPRIEGLSIDVPPSRFSHYKLVARPTRKHPDGDDSKKRKLWLMVGEVLLN